jgi:hypothetical protein
LVGSLLLWGPPPRFGRLCRFLFFYELISMLINCLGAIAVWPWHAFWHEVGRRKKINWRIL